MPRLLKQTNINITPPPRHNAQIGTIFLGFSFFSTVRDICTVSVFSSILTRSATLSVYIFRVFQRSTKTVSLMVFIIVLSLSRSTIRTVSRVAIVSTRIFTTSFASEVVFCAVLQPAKMQQKHTNNAIVLALILL